MLLYSTSCLSIFEVRDSVLLFSEVRNLKVAICNLTLQNYWMLYINILTRDSTILNILIVSFIPYVNLFNQEKWDLFKNVCFDLASAHEMMNDIFSFKSSFFQDLKRFTFWPLVTTWIQLLTWAYRKIVWKQYCTSNELGMIWVDPIFIG